MKNILLYSLNLVFIGINAALIGNELNDESALYSISSLHCHIIQEIEFNRKSTHKIIYFDSENVSRLWEQAKQSTEAKTIKKAELHYIRSQTVNPEDADFSLCRAQHLIDKAWKKLNPYYITPISKSSDLQRYFLPEDHWLKGQLDIIFTPLDVLKNERHFSSAGFKTICKRSSDMIVAEHEKIPGYLIKTYLQIDKPEKNWKWMINRCLGAENIRNLIKAKKLRYFTVPDKWIYPLPNQDVESLIVAPEETALAVLVVTHMKVGDYTYSKEAWRTKITRKHLRELYCILSHGFASCYLAQNIPYTKNGIFTCLDTEYPYRIHRLEKVGSVLSPEMRSYWQLLVQTGGKGK